MRARARAMREKYERRKLHTDSPPARTKLAPPPARARRGITSVRRGSEDDGGGDVWSGLWTERPSSTFARAERFGGARAALQKPSMRSYLQYLKAAVGQGEGAGEVPGTDAPGRPHGARERRSTTPGGGQPPGPGAYDPVPQGRGEMFALTFPRAYPRFPHPIPAARRNCVKLFYPEAQQHASRGLLDVPLAKSIDRGTQRTDFTKLRESTGDTLLEPDAGTKQSLATGARNTPMRYSACFRSSAPRLARSLAHSTSEELGPGRYDGVPGLVRSDRFTALESLGVKEPRRVNSSFLSPPRKPLDAV